MACQSVSKTCLQCLRLSPPLAPATRTRVTVHTSNRNLHTRTSTALTPPLYLDFLAPSWQTQRRQSNQNSHFRALVSRSTVAHNKSQHWPLPQQQQEQQRIQRQQQRRAFTTSLPTRAAAVAAASTAPAAIAIQNPRQDAEGNELTITITPRAAQRLQRIADSDGNPQLALRVSVESGGCHGFQYLMSLTSAAEVDGVEDTVFENVERVAEDGGGGGEAYRAKVVMDEPSLQLLKGSTVDYTMELIGSQFKVTGIPGAKSSCGCGTSFDLAVEGLG